MAAGEGKTTTSSGGVTMSQRDLVVIAAAWQSIEGEPKIDYDKFTALAGYGSVDSARVSWRNLKKKLFAASADGSSSGTTPVATPKASSATKKAGGGSARSKKTATPGTATIVKKELFSPVGVDGAEEQDELSAAAEAQDTPTKRKRDRPAGGGGGGGSSGSPARKKGRVTTIKEHMAIKKEEEMGEEHGVDIDEDGREEKFSVKLEEPTGDEEA